MGGIGLGEFIIILAILVVVLGAGRLPQLGDSLGRAIRAFRRAASEDDRIQVISKGEGEGRKDALPREETGAAPAEPKKPEG